MDWQLYLPFWNDLSTSEQDVLKDNCFEMKYPGGTPLTDGDNCSGLMIIKQGKVRVYTLSDEGKEITLYRLYNYDLCLLSSSCIFNSITFDTMIDTEEETTIVWIPTKIYDNLMKTSISVSNYTNELMADRFSEVMWVLDQVLSKKMDQRIAAFLIEEADYQQSDHLELTHDKIARHLGTAREVISRLLRYFQKEEMIDVSRKSIDITDRKKLEALLK